MGWPIPLLLLVSLGKVDPGAPKDDTGATRLGDRVAARRLVKKNDSWSAQDGAPPKTAAPPAAGRWCCVRYVHIGKCAGTSFDEWAKRTKVVDAETFHHPVTWFLDGGVVLQPRCLVGVTLREPVAHLFSRFKHCLGRACVRHHVDYACGFVACARGSALQKGYEVPAALQPANRAGLLELMAREPGLWHQGRNLQTRMLGQASHAGDARWSTKVAHPGFSNTYIDWSEDLANGTANGAAYLDRAKLRLLLFDFVIVVERIDDGYAKQLDARGGAPHENTAAEQHDDWALPEGLEAPLRSLLELGRRRP
jgi:hypothetical protein